MIGAALFSRLKADGGVAGVCGTRVYPNYIREGDQLYPQAVYKFTGDTEEVCYDGNAGLAYAEVTITAVGKTYADADALADAIVAALDEGEGRWGPYVVLGCWKGETSQDVVHDPATEEILYFLQELQFSVSYRNDGDQGEFDDAFSEAFA